MGGLQYRMEPFGGRELLVDLLWALVLRRCPASDVDE